MSSNEGDSTRFESLTDLDLRKALNETSSNLKLNLKWLVLDEHNLSSQYRHLKINLKNKSDDGVSSDEKEYLSVLKHSRQLQYDKAQILKTLAQREEEKKKIQQQMIQKYQSEVNPPTQEQVGTIEESKKEEEVEEEGKDSEAAALKLRLKSLLADVEVEEQEFQEEFEKTLAEIKKQDDLGRPKPKQYEGLQNKFKILQECKLILQELSSNAKGPNPQAELKAKLKGLLQELEITDENEIPEELATQQARLDEAIKKNKSKQKSEAEAKIKIIEEIQAIIEQISEVGVSPELKKKMQDLQTELEIGPDEDLEEETKKAETELLGCAKKPKRAQELTERIEKLKQLSQIQDQIHPKKKPQTIPTTSPSLSQQPLPQASANDPNKLKMQSDHLQFQRAVLNINHCIELPECFEKLLLKLSYYSYLKQFNKKDEILKVENINEEILRIQQDMKYQFAQESFQQASLKEQINNLIIESNPDFMMRLITEILNKVKPFSFQEFFELYSHVDSAALKIKNKDIILLLGSTGCGKSTTIHYLCGSKMNATTINGLPHIEALEVRNHELLEVKTSAFSKSETRFVTPIKINQRDLGAKQDQFTILVDTPGSEDTESAEVDLSNCLGIIKAISNAKSVRPVIIFSYKNFGGRNEKLKALIKFYGSMINNIQENIKKATYFFTHVDEKFQMAPLLQDVLDNLTPQEKLDDNLKYILEHMIEQAENKLTKIINPLDGKPLQIIKQILQNNPITYPGEVFQSRIHPQSHLKVLQQLDVQVHQILSSVKNQSPEICNFKISEIQRFCELFPNEQVYQDKYQECLQQLHKILQENFTNSINKFNKCLSSSNSMSDIDIQEFNKAYNQAKFFDDIVKQFLFEKFKTFSSASFIANIQTTAQLQFEELKTQEISKGCWPAFIKKLEMIANYILECEPLLDKTLLFYKDLTDKKSKKISKLILTIKTADYQNVTIMPQDQFESSEQQIEQNSSENNDQKLHQKLAKEMKNFFTASIKFTNYQKFQELLSKQHSELSKEIITQLQNRSEIVMNQLPKNNAFVEILVETICNINSIINLSQQFIQSFTNEYENKAITDASKYIKVQIINAVRACFDKQYDDLLEILKSSEKYNLIKKKFDQLCRYRQISLIEVETNQKFYFIDNRLRGKLFQKQSEIDQQLQDYQSSTGKRDVKALQKLKDSLNILKELGWMQGKSQAVEFDEVRNQLKNTFIEQITQLVQQIEGKFVGLENLEELKNVVLISAQIREIYNISKIIELTLDEQQEEWKLQVLKAIKTINTTITKLIEEEQILKIFQYRKMQQYYEYLHYLTTNNRQVGLQTDPSDESTNPSEIFIKLREDLLQNQEKLINQQFERSKDILLGLTKEEKKDIQEIENKIESETQNIYNILQIIKDLQQKYPVLYLIVDQDGSLNTLLNSVDNFSKKLINQLNDSFKFNTISFQINLSILQHSVKLDMLLEDNQKKFGHEYEIWVHKDIDDKDEVIKETAEFIQKSQFNKIKQKLDDLEGLKTNQSLKQIEQIKELIQGHCSKQISEIRSFTRQNENQLSRGEAITLNLIAENLLEISAQIDPKYLDPRQSIVKTLDELHRFITQDIQNNLRICSTYLQMRKFFEARNHLQLAENIQKQLQFEPSTDQESSISYLQDLQKQTQEEKKKFDSELYSYVSHYEQVKIKKYEKEMPGQLISNLVKDCNMFQNHLQRLIQIISSSYKAEYTNIEKMLSDNKDINKIMKKFNDFENSYQYLIPQIDESQKKQVIALQVSEEIKTIKVNIDKLQKKVLEMKKEQSEIEQQILGLGNPDRIIEMLSSKKKFNITDEVKKRINELYKDRCTQAIYLANTNPPSPPNIQKLLKDLLPEIEKYSHEVFIQIITDPEKLNDQLIKDTRNIFIKSIDELKVYFVERNPHDSDNEIIRNLNNSQSEQTYVEILTIFKNQSEDKLIQKIIQDYQYHISNFQSHCTLFLQKQKNQFNKAISRQEDVDFEEIKLILQNFKFSDKILVCLNRGKLIEYFKLEQYLNIYEESIKQFGRLVSAAKQKIDDLSLVTDETNRSQQNRKVHFENIQKILSLFRDSKKLKNDLEYYSSINIELTCIEAEKAIVEKIDQIINQLNQTANNISMQMRPQVLVNFNQNYAHLKELKQIVKLDITKINNALTLVDDVIENKLQEKRTALNQAQNVNEISKNLVELKFISENLVEKSEIITQDIKDSLKAYKNKHKGNMQAISELALVLKQSPQGGNIVSENSEFKAYEQALFNEKKKKMGLENVLSKLEGDHLDLNKLRTRYNTFAEKYKEILLDLLKPRFDQANNRLPPDTSVLVSNILHCTDKQTKKWGKDQIDKLPELLAMIFSLWTLMNCQSYVENQKEDQDAQNYLLQPHVAQVISIFRILGLGYSQFNYDGFKKKVKKLGNYIFGQEPEKQSVYNNLVQIKTGEGKSITLAVVSIVFALFGFEVNCACYSEYLSMRDYQAFEDMFKELGLTNYIRYGTFNQLCEHQINKNGNIRDIFLGRVLKNHQAKSQVPCNNLQRPQIMLIDEVDVFFSKDFYGAQYRPQATISDPSVADLIDYIWSIKDNKSQLVLKQVQSTSQYQACLQIFKDPYKELLTEAVKDMICDVKDFHLHDYYEVGGLIGYKDQDQISFNISYGYKTMFAYYQKFDQGKVSQEVLNKNKVIGLNCGEFSFAEVPHEFELILGVSGTLKTLSDSEKKIISDAYKIENFTYSPSVYGDSNLIFDERQDIKILAEDQFYNNIVNNIKENLKSQKGDRAVIVFFESLKKLDNFYKSPEFSQYKEECFVLEESLNNKEKENLITKSTYAGQVTIATRKFGRGTDFICKDVQVEKNGGVHVIQTFLSEEMSEEVQIMGRTARQGDKGSYCLILLDEDLKYFNIEEKDIERNKSNYQQMLYHHRNLTLQSTKSNDSESLEVKKIAHENSINQSSKALDQSSTDDEIFIYLREINLGRSITKSTKTLILMDATGSMQNLIEKTKNAISEMFQDASKILIDHQIDPKLVEIQFGCYRNYSSGPEQIFEHSSWESDPISLNAYMTRITWGGGQGHEAIEIALQYANFISNQDPENQPSQIFVIGDAPPNTEQDIKDKRRGRDYFNGQGKFFESQTFYQWELKNLKAKNIRIYTFYVHSQAQKAFTEIATETGGTCEFLDVNSTNGKQLLIKLFVSQILRAVGDSQGGQGEKLVKAYAAHRA